MEPKQSFLKSLLALFVKEDKIIEELPGETEPVLVDNAKDDLKDLAKMFLKMLELLPDDELRDFKETPEFDQFKKILRRHNIIK